MTIPVKTNWLSVLLFFSTLPMVAQQAEPAQPSLKDEKLTADPATISGRGIIFMKESCKLGRPEVVKGKATGPQPGDFEGTVKKLVANMKTGEGDFDACFTVNTSAGKVVINNKQYKQLKPVGCIKQGLPSPAQSQHIVFEFSTQYDATLPRGNRHLCGEAIVSGNIGWQSLQPFEPAFSETIKTEKACPPGK